MFFRVLGFPMRLVLTILCMVVVTTGALLGVIEQKDWTRLERELLAFIWTGELHD